MKSKFVAHILLVDCGKASTATRGSMIGGISEIAAPPFNHVYPG